MSHLYDGKNVTSLTMSLMAVDSTTGNEKAATDLLADHLRTRGWKVVLQPLEHQPHRVNIVAHRQECQRPGDDNWKQPIVILNSHIDTVPPFIPPSFDADTGTIYGRGSCDAKGVIAAMIFGAEKFIRENEHNRDDVALLFVVGEEVDHCGAIESQKLKMQPKFVICGEPTELKQAVGQKGIYKVNLIAKGKAAHSGYPHLGDSAIKKLLDALQKVHHVKWPVDDNLGPTTLNIGLIRGGTAANIIPSSAEATLAFRTVTEPETLLKMLKTELSDLDVTVVEIAKGNAPLKLHTFVDIPSHVVCFNTDIPYLGFDQSRCKSVLYGPGSILVAHGPDEHITMSDLESAVDMYKTLLSRMIV